jgi:hypothetical protein
LDNGARFLELEGVILKNLHKMSMTFKRSMIIYNYGWNFVHCVRRQSSV